MYLASNSHRCGFSLPWFVRGPTLPWKKQQGQALHFTPQNIREKRGQVLTLIICAVFKHEQTITPEKSQQEKEDATLWCCDKMENLFIIFPDTFKNIKPTRK